MKFKSLIVKIFAVSALLGTVTACVSDVDFDQADEVIFKQQVDLALVFFTLEAADFEGANENAAMAVVRDTTRLEFLEEDFTQENLKEIEFTFKATNTFGQSLLNRSQFLNESGVLQYELMFEIMPSTDGLPVTTTIIENLTEVEIEAVRNAIQVVSETTVLTNGAPIIGSLNVQSKALYSLEFSDL